MGKRRIYWLLALILIILIGIIVLKQIGIWGNDDAIKVAIETIQKKDIIESVSASGKLYPVSEVKMSPDVSGEIIDLLVEEGDRVYKGQLLGTINSTIYKTMVTRAAAQLNQSKSIVSNSNAQLQQVKALLDQATTVYMRNKELFDEKIISATEFEEYETRYRTALANYRSAIENIKSNQYSVSGSQANVQEAVQTLQKTILYAPMTGIISKLFVKKGERVVGTAQMAGTEIMRIADMSRMKVDVEVGENDIQKVKIGDTSNIQVEAYNGKTFKGVVTKISQSSSNTGMQQSISSLTDQVTNYTVSIEVIPESYQFLLTDNPKTFPFRPGMSASVDILTKYRRAVTAVPINAVTTREKNENEEENENKTTENTELIFVIDSTNHAKEIKVTTGAQDNKYIEILSELNNGQRVITAPYSAIARTLKDKSLVRIVKKKELFEERKKD